MNVDSFLNSTACRILVM